MLYASRRHVNYSYVKMATDIYIIRGGQLAHQFNEPKIFLLNSEFTQWKFEKKIHLIDACPREMGASLTCVIIKAANNLKIFLFKATII